MSSRITTTKEKKNMQKAISEKASPISEKSGATATFKSRSGSSSSSSIGCFGSGGSLLSRLFTRRRRQVFSPTTTSSASTSSLKTANSTFSSSAASLKLHKQQEAVATPPPPPPFECIICFNTWSGVLFTDFKTDKCTHTVCKECMRGYMDGALKDNRYTNYHTIECPDTDCKACFVSDDVLDKIYTPMEAQKWWVEAITKTFIENKIYCPLSGCDALFDVDAALTRQCTFTECWSCRRGFCIACQDRWHPGVIKVFDDAKSIEKTLKFAESKNWTRCYNCNRFVEKKAGCLAIRCVCRVEFCYRCGGKMTDHHTCSRHCENYTMEQLAALRSPMFVNKEAATTSAAAANKAGASAATPIVLM